MAAKNSTPTEPLFSRPQRIGAALGVLAVLGLVGKQLWNGAQAHIRSSAHYRVTAAEIAISLSPIASPLAKVVFEPRAVPSPISIRSTAPAS